MSFADESQASSKRFRPNPSGANRSSNDDDDEDIQILGTATHING